MSTSGFPPPVLPFPSLPGSAPESPSPCEHNWETAKNPPSPGGFGGGNIRSVSEKGFYLLLEVFLLQLNGISAGGLGPAVPCAERQENIPAFHSCCFYLVMSLSTISSSWNGHGVTTPQAQCPKPAFILMGIGWKKGWNVGGCRIDGLEEPVLCLGGIS